MLQCIQTVLENGRRRQEYLYLSDGNWEGVHLLLIILNEEQVMIGECEWLLTAGKAGEHFFSRAFEKITTLSTL